MAESLTTYTIKPAEISDVPLISKMHAHAFLIDRQTQMKALGSRPYDLEELGIDDNLNKLSHPEKCRVIKAVDNTTGQLVGSCAWLYRCLSKEEIIEAAESTDAELQRQERVKQEAQLALAERQRVAAEAKATGSLEEMSWADYKAVGSRRDDPIVRLEALTGADMERMQAILEPPNTKCIAVAGLSVDPAFQGRGIGGALLGTLNRVADRAGVHIWVHSSEPGWQAYHKAGFDVVETLDVDLDEYAPVSPPDWYICEEEGKWGHYVFRYMKRMPVKSGP